MSPPYIPSTQGQNQVVAQAPQTLLWVPFCAIGLRLSIEDREVEPDSLCEIPLELVCAQDQTLQTKRNMYMYMYIVIVE